MGMRRVELRGGCVVAAKRRGEEEGRYRKWGWRCGGLARGGGVSVRYVPPVCGRRVSSRYRSFVGGWTLLYTQHTHLPRFGGLRPGSARNGSSTPARQGYTARMNQARVLSPFLARTAVRLVSARSSCSTHPRARDDSRSPVPTSVYPNTSISENR